MDTSFLLWSLFFPRIVLVYYYANSWIPTNIVPFWGDVAASVFIPRVLILLYIGANLGMDNVWFVVHLIFAILAYAGGGASVTIKKE